MTEASRGRQRSSRLRRLGSIVPIIGLLCQLMLSPAFAQPSADVRNADHNTGSVIISVVVPPCFGDCNQDGEVSVNELILLVNISLGNAPARLCDLPQPPLIQDFIRAVNNALSEFRVYRIALGSQFIPWDVGPLEGVDFDVLAAICRANPAMKCRLENRPFSDCFDSDAEGNEIVGAGLASGQVDGCISWFDTPEREQLGAEFGDGYSRGPTPQLIASNANVAFDELGAEGSLAQAVVGFKEAFFNDEACLRDHYSDFRAAFFAEDQAGTEAMVNALLDGSIDLAFWYSVNIVPDGTHLVGAPIRTCGQLIALVTYPPSMTRKHKADELRRDYNCGLALIRESGELDQICTGSPHPGGDPACVLEGPPPTVQCRTQFVR